MGNVNVGDVKFSVFDWYKNNSVARFQTISDSRTHYFDLLVARSSIIIDFMSFFFNIRGRPLQENTNIFRTTVVGIAIIIQRETDEEGGEISLSTIQEKNGGKSSPLFSQVNNVIDGVTYIIQTVQDNHVFFGSFQDGEYPGPISLDPGDRIRLAVLCSDNFINWTQPEQSTLTMISGNFNYQIRQTLEQVNPSSMTSRKQLEAYKKLICIENNDCDCK